eukprot:656204-Pleurochrysis_carterae.AAC.1
MASQPGTPELAWHWTNWDFKQYFPGHLGNLSQFADKRVWIYKNDPALDSCRCSTPTTQESFSQHDLPTSSRTPGYIHSTTCPPHVHELNGVAERAIRSIMEL